MMFFLEDEEEETTAEAARDGGRWESLWRKTVDGRSNFVPCCNGMDGEERHR
jgi:hypothetical protein